MSPAALILVFGSGVFLVLSWTYWRQRATAARPQTPLFSIFTAACAVAFGVNLLASILPSLSLPPFEIVRTILTGLLPVMMTHLAAPSWRISVVGLYLTVLAELLLPSADDLPAWRLAACATLGILAMIAAPRTRHAWWNLAIFASLLACSLGSLFFSDSAASLYLALLPDYLLLLFFAVWLYFSERLAFFDTVFKGGLYFALGAGLLSLAAPGTAFEESPLAWILLLAAWQAAPALHRGLSRWIDRHVLHRRYGPIEAERVFVHAIQGASTRGALDLAAAHALREIFQTAAAVREPRDSQTPEQPALAAGALLLQPRPDGIPFLSGDRRLLEILASAYDLARANTDARVQQDQLAALARGAELRALRAQINPHFLFNALNAIAGWIRVRPDLADETVERLAGVFRYALDRSSQEWVPLEEEIEFIGSYLAVEKSRFGDRLDISVAPVLPPGEAACRIPAMLLQPLVENAMKHAVPNASPIAKVHVSIQADVESRRLRLTVEDNGPGFPRDFRIAEGHALHNVTQRLRGYFGPPPAAALICENTGMGCRVTLDLPIPDGHGTAL